jgi:hypothetical protein
MQVHRSASISSARTSPCSIRWTCNFIHKHIQSAPEVLFVCVHNAGRSQMAAGLLDRRAQGRVQVRSAGSPADEVNPPVVQAMEKV